MMDPPLQPGENQKHIKMNSNRQSKNFNDGLIGAEFSKKKITYNAGSFIEGDQSYLAMKQAKLAAGEKFSKFKHKGPIKATSNLNN